MTVINDDDAPRFDAGGTHVVGLAAPSRGSAETSAWRFTLDPGAASPPHTLDREEIIIAVGGDLQVDLAGERSHLGPGGAVIISAGMEVVLSNETSSPFEGIACLPAGAQATVDGEASSPPWAV
jgi:quercetin dioxygenase-like cupin family protein